MRRALVLLSVLCVSFAVSADTKNPAKPAKPVKPAAPTTPQGALQKLILDHVGVIEHYKEGVDGDTYVLYPTGDVRKDDQPIDDHFNAAYQGTILQTPDKITLGIDEPHGVAWFQVPVEIEMSPEMAEMKPTIFKRRIGGIAVGKGTRWSFAALQYSSTLDDKLMLKEAASRKYNVPVKGAPKLMGDAKIAKVVADWFKTGFASHAAPSPAIVASGTSPTEYQTGAGAAKLAKSWDGLKLGASEVETHSVANGAAVFVRAEVMMPLKGGKGAAPMHLGAILVPDADSWRWVSLQFSTDLGNGT